MGYERYPLIMRHPNEQPAVIGKEAGQGSPAKLQPVTVMTWDQEQEYIAKGYKSNTSQQAFEDLAAIPDPEYAYQEYPKWVGDRIVNSSAEEQALTKKRA